jgi:phage baseplate assembly protein W
MARLSRALVLTGQKRETELFSDFTNNFLKTPVGDQLARNVNNNSIKQALKNLILTNQGERLFNYGIGGNLNLLLFENNVAENLSRAEFLIRNTIEQYEPRIQLLQLIVTPSENNENAVNITIVYNTINNSEPITITILFKRVR